MAYLKGVARLAAGEDLPIRWTTPVGFIIQQAYYDTSARRVNTMINGRRIMITVREDKPSLSKTEQANGISPNFIHSLDASHLMFTVLEAERRGITSLSLIHDSFGTHASDAETLFFCVRETMAAMYTQFDVFRDFRDEVWHQLSDDRRRDLESWDQQAFPAQGELDPDVVAQSRYAFA